MRIFNRKLKPIYNIEQCSFRIKWCYGRMDCFITDRCENCCSPIRQLCYEASFGELKLLAEVIES